MPLANPNDLPGLVAACRAALASSGPIEVAEEYGYASLPLCVIDSVFSIGVRYEGVRNVIERTSLSEDRIIGCWPRPDNARVPR